MSSLDVLTPPSMGRQLGSVLYELLIVVVVLLVAAACFQPVFIWFGEGAATHIGLQLWLLGVLYGYFSWCWCRGGQTLAMKTWGIRLVQSNGQAMNHYAAARRFVIAACLMLGMPAVAYLAWSKTVPMGQAILFAAFWVLLPYLWGFYEKDRRFLHDRLAGTRQIRVKNPPRKP